MPKFSHLHKLDVNKQATAVYELYQLEDTPTLTLTPAFEVNKPFFNKQLQRSRKVASQVRAAGINAGMVSQMREEDKKLYPKYVIVGWTGIVDDKGQEVAFSKDVCAEWLACLPNDIFDDIRDFAGTPGNFREQIDAEEAAKN